MFLKILFEYVEVYKVNSNKEIKFSELFYLSLLVLESPGIINYIF